MFLGQYVVKFEELSKFSSYLRFNPDENWKSVKFESRLKLEIKNAMRAFEIRDYDVLVNKCRIIERN